MSIKSAILGLVSSFCLCGVTYAEMSAPFGWYLEPNVGLTKIVNTAYSGSTNTAGLGLNINVGYKFMPYFATELGYTRYANIKVRDPSTATTAITDQHTGLHLALKGIFPLSLNGFEAFAKIGIQRLTSKISIQNSVAANNIGVTAGTSKNSSGMYMGIGAQFYYMPEMPIVVQWSRAKGSVTTGTLDFWSVGVSYLFS